MTCSACGVQRLFVYEFGSVAWCAEASFTTALREGWRSRKGEGQRCPNCAGPDDYQLPEILDARRFLTEKGSAP